MQLQSQFSQLEPIIKFLVATDIHLGVNENGNLRSKRGQDSYDAFEEILQIAEKNKVDFLIIAGDLFHEKRPSEHCLFKCIDVLQKYVFGSNFGGISVEKNELNYQPNFHDANFNVQLPIFIINGNHDNFITEQDEHVSILDILHQSKYLNYFGKITNQSQINVKPIIIVKNVVRIALYGIGYIKDYQFSKLLMQGKIILEDLDERNYNILIIHQNRYKGTHFSEEKDFLDPMQFKKFKINLLIWGHEHEAYFSIIFRKYNLEQVEHFHVFMCGSSVATSIIEAEGYVKQSGLFTVTPEGYQFQSLKLHSSHRPIIIKSVELSELVKRDSNGPKQTTQELAEKRLFDLLDGELRKYYAENPYRRKPPLVRIKVEHTGFELMKLKFMESKFSDRVANPEKIFQFWEKKQHLQSKNEKRLMDVEMMNKNFDQILGDKKFAFENEQSIVDCTYMIKQKLENVKGRVINPADFMTLMELGKKSEKGNPFEALQNQVIQKHKQSVIQEYQKELEGIIKKMKDTENELVFGFKSKMFHDFKSENRQKLEMKDSIKYQNSLNRCYDSFLSYLTSPQTTQATEPAVGAGTLRIHPNAQRPITINQQSVLKDESEEEIMFFDMMDLKSKSQVEKKLTKDECQSIEAESQNGEPGHQQPQMKKSKRKAPPRQNKKVQQNKKSLF